MDINKVELAENEALRLLQRIREVKVRAKLSEYDIRFGCKETAALKRQSMELTNALVDLRKPN